MSLAISLVEYLASGLSLLPTPARQIEFRNIPHEVRELPAENY